MVSVRFDSSAGKVERREVSRGRDDDQVEGDDEGLKLEEQVLVTTAGVEILSRAPHDEHLAS